MPCNGLYSILLTTFFLSIAVTWVAAVPAVQVGSNRLRRDLYVAAKPKFFPEYLEDLGAMPDKAEAQQAAQWPSRLEGNAYTGGLSRELTVPANSRYLSVVEAGDRLERNLDQIGGGNLLRRGLREQWDSTEASRWFPSRRNLDQIGGGNLLRNADDRTERNLDQIGGGNLVRDLNGLFTASDELRRNLDQIGGGNLVRSLSEMVRKLGPGSIEERSRTVKS